MIWDLSFGICHTQNQGVFLRIQSETPTVCWETGGEMCRLCAHHGVTQNLLFLQSSYSINKTECYKENKPNCLETYQTYTLLKGTRKLAFTLTNPLTLFTSAIKGLPELQEKGTSPLCFYIWAPGKFICTNVCKQVSSQGLFSCFFTLLAAHEPVGAIRIICWKGAGNSCTSPLHTARASAPRPAHICLLGEIKK